MKYLLALFAMSILMINGVIAQNWKSNLAQDKVQDGTITFQDIQHAFYQEYPADKVPNGKRMVDGKLTKIPGWKLFKRWEYFWETRIDLETGLFPSKAALEELSIGYSNKAAITGGGSWSDVGPTTSSGGYAGLGRVNTVGYHPTDNNTFWAGTAGGGLWKTTNGGTSWTVQTDNNDVLGVSAIAIPSDYATSNTIFIGTGDKNGSDNNSVGILKSTDGGTSWEATDLTFNIGDGEQVCRIIIDPTNDQLMLAATTDGIYKSIDAGITWLRKTGTGIYRDMEYKPGDPSTVYASAFSTFYKSTNGGDTWSTVQTITGSGIEICVSPAQPTWVYALVVNGDGGIAGIYKSTNSGANYSTVFTGGGTNGSLFGYYCDGTGNNEGQGWYDRCIAVNPINANELFIGGINTWKSTNGGTSWTSNNMWTSYNLYNSCGSPVVHADKHYLGFQNGTSTLFEGNDGGLYKTSNAGSSWSHISSGMSISQMYKLGVSQTVANETVTGLQDNGTKLYSGNTWYDVKGGDGMECLIDYTDVNVQYGTYVHGQLDRTTDHWGSRTDISANIPGELDGAWVSPYVIDPENNQTLYMGYSDVWKTTNRGNSWMKISTMNTPDDLRAMAIAPSNNQVLYVSDPNQIWKTTNGGTGWTDITGTLPVGSSTITYMAIKSDDPNTLWVTFGQYNTSKVYQSINGGTSWTNISAGLPSIPVSSVVENTQNPADVELYVSTDVGVYQRIGANNWTPYSTNLPNVKVGELEIYYDTDEPENSKLRAATYGRGLWESELPSLVLCTAPSNQANSFNATAIGDNQMTVNWTRGNGSRVVVLAHEAGAVSSNPSTGESYIASADAIFGNGTEIGTGNYVVYDGTGTNVTLTGLTPGTAYHYSVFEYASADNCYLKPGLTGSATTTGLPPCTVCDDVTSNTDDGTGITSFSFNSINNTSLGDPAYTDNTSISTTVLQGSSYNLAVNVNTVGNYLVTTKVWIDWNRNCDFTDAGEVYDLGTASNVTNGASSLSPLSIMVPAGAIIGNTILRVRAAYGSISPSCGNQNWGEAEDYTINVISSGPVPVANFSGTPTTICEGSLVTFTDASTENPTAWAWTFGDGGTSALQNPTHTYSVAGDYTVVLTATNANGWDIETKTNYITVVGEPNAGTNGTLTVCEGTTPGEAELFAQLGGSPDNGGTWTNSGLVYTYTVNATSPCTGTETATITVTEQAVPNAGTNGTLTICEGTMPTDAQLFAALGGSPDSDGAWTNVGLIYTYTVSAISPCTGNASAIVTLTEHAAPNAGINGTLTVCEGTTPTYSELFAALNGSPDSDGSWTNVGLIHTYTVYATSPCADNASAIVTLTEQAAPFAGTNGTLTICEGTVPTDAQLFAALGGSPHSGGTWTHSGLVYTYSVNATAPCTGNHTAMVTVNEQAAPYAGANGTLAVCEATTPTDAQLFAALGGSPDAGGIWTNVGLIYTYTVSTTSPCIGTASAIVTLTEHAAPNAGTNGTLTVCEGTTPTYSGLFAALNGSPDNGGSWTNSGLVYTYTVNALTPCTGYATAIVTVIEDIMPIAASNANAEELTICKGESTTISYTGGSGTTFEWYTASCGGTSLGSGNNLTVSPTSTTTYYGRWENSCENSTCVSVEIMVIEMPILTMSSTNANCSTSDGTATVVATGGTGVYSYLWDDATAQTNAVAIDLEQGDYNVEVTSGACVVSGMTTVNENAAPEVSATASLTTICEGETTVITATGADTYIWTPTTGLDVSTGDAVNASPDADITYTVTGTSLACSASSSVEITVNHLPNVSFTIDASGEPVIDFTNTATGADAYSWDLGDATSETSTDVSHEYPSNGTYTVVLSATNECGTETAQQDVIITNVGITALGEENIKIYPNPTETILNIRLPIENVNIQLVSIDGKILRTIQSKEANHIQINVEDLASGFYNLVLTTESDQQVMVKVVKK